MVIGLDLRLVLELLSLPLMLLVYLELLLLFELYPRLELLLLPQYSKGPLPLSLDMGLNTHLDP